MEYYIASFGITLICLCVGYICMRIILIKFMKKVYCQPYTNNRAIESWYGKPPKGHFKYDQIKIRIPFAGEQTGQFLYMTPNEAIDIIRALSAATNHWLMKEKSYHKIVKALNK